MGQKYLGLMGMTEMELAVGIMEQMALTKGICISGLCLYPKDFLVPKDSHVSLSIEDIDFSILTGFCQLLAHGWLEPDYPNSRFIPSKHLIQRLNERWGTNYRDSRHLWEKPNCGLPIHLETEKKS